MEIGDRIRQKRIQLGLSQDELAQKAGYKNRSSIHKMEKNLQRPQVDDLPKLAKALDVHVDWLVNGIEIERTQYKDLDEKSHLFDYVSRLYGSSAAEAVDLFSKLDDYQKGKIIGQMEQMTKHI